MDNRYATLPLWSTTSLQESRTWATSLQGAASMMKVGTISLDGPMFSLAFEHDFSNAWHWGVVGFYDALSFKSGQESRPLQTLFAPATPIERPVDALFTNLDGQATDLGGGFFFARTSNSDGLLGKHRWVTGVLWQQVELSDYRFDYEIVEGPQSGLTGTIDFDATYEHIVPFVGLEVPRDFGNWTASMHGLLAVPLPRRGVEGHITGPGFDLSGDSASAGNGKHFGDVSVTIGLNLTYRPARLSVDVGTLLSQALIEPVVHSGIDQNLVLSVLWTY